MTLLLARVSKNEWSAESNVFYIPIATYNLFIFDELLSKDNGFQFQQKNSVFELS